MIKKQVISDSTEWVQIDHQVQVITGKSSIKLIGAYKFEEPQQNTDAIMIKNSKDKAWVDATINITDLSKESYRQIVQKQIPMEDLIVYAGHVNIHKYSNQPYKVFTFLLCKVWLGTIGSQNTLKLENCDSKLIKSDNQAFQYNFYLKKYSQYQIKYEVSFTVSEDKQFKLTQLSCCNCENRIPSIFCATEKLYFCEECCNDHHKTKLMYSHQLQGIDRVNTLDNCKTHNLKYELYCLKCEKYLCAQCIQKGVHAQGSDHIIKPIRYLYEELNQNIEAIPKKNLEKIEVLLNNLAIKRKQIQQNQKQILQQIEREYQKCLRMLQQEVVKKYQLLDSCQLQLLMLKDKIAWNESFCVYQSSALKPIHFFKSQSLFEMEMKKIKVLDFDSVLSCKPDLVYKCLNIVGTRDAVEKNQQFNQQIKKESQLYANIKVDNKYEIPQGSNQNASPTMPQNLPSKVASQEKIQTIFSFDPNAQRPANNQLFSDLLNCNFRYFKIKAK